MDLTDTHMQVAYGAWAAAQDGGGVVIDKPILFVAAHELAEHGWLRRRYVTEPGELSWWWTPAADTALGLNALMESGAGRQN
jgi:hypothetical protein